MKFKCGDTVRFVPDVTTHQYLGGITRSTEPTHLVVSVLDDRSIGIVEHMGLQYYKPSAFELVDSLKETVK